VKILIDTNTYSDAMRGVKPVVTLLQRANEILLCPVVMGELLAGFRKGTREKANRELLWRFLASPRVRAVGMNRDTSEFYATVLDGVRRKGTSIPTNDIWIAASTMEHGARLATGDSHFQTVDGLLLVQVR